MKTVGQWLREFDLELQRMFGLTTQDAGVDNEEATGLYLDHTDNPEIAVIEFGNKYELTPIGHSRVLFA